MRTDSVRGLPTVMRASRADTAWATASYCDAGTRTRRMAVHFCPDLTVISRTTSLTSRSKAGEPAASPGISSAEFRLSASTFARTERDATAGWPRTAAAVSAEPVKDTTSKGSSASSSPAEEPHTTDSAPAGSTPDSTTSRTMRCVSQAVAVAGLTTTGTPDSSAGAAFSHRPQDGKLKALMNSARPCTGNCTWRLRKLSSLPSFTASPSSRKRRSPSEAASFA